MISLCWVMLASIISFAQTPKINKNLNQYNLEHWTTKNGLPDNAIIHTLFSETGYLWLVSYGGISRFNGRDFKNFNSYNTPSITNNSFTHIFEDKDGVIWAASSGGGLATVKNDAVHIYTTVDGLPSNFIEEVVQDESGRLWVATSDGLCYLKDNKFENTETPEQLKTERLKSLDVDKEGTLWVATTSEGLYAYKKSKELKLFNTSNGLVSNTINYVRYDDDRIWVGTEDGLSIISADNSIENLTTDDGLPHKVVSSSLVDPVSRAVFVGTFKGFVRFKDGIADYPSKGSPLHNNDFTNIINDYEGNIWVSTYRKGLFKLWNGKFTNYSIDKSHITYPYIVHAIFRDNQENLFVVHELGINKLDLKNNTIVEYDIGYKFTETKLKYGLWDSKGNLWIGTGEFLLKSRDGRVEKFNDTNGLVHDNVRTIYEDKSGKIWVGTNNGISVIHENGSIKNYTPETGLSHEYIMHFNELSDGRMAIATRNGLNLFNGEKFESYHMKDGMAGDFVFKTYEDKQGILWVCGNAGLTRYKDGEFKHITSHNGLGSNTIFQILEDDLGNFWMTTNQKNITVFKVSKDELNDYFDGKISEITSVEFTKADGLQSSSATSSGTSFKTRDGLLLFATNEGIEVIDPENINQNKRKPPVVIEEFKVENEVISLDSAVVIAPGKQRITIKFAALSYVASDKLQYKYKLEGFDETWQDAEGVPETSYTNLAPGDYTFKVIGANSDGIWNQEGAAISFTKTPFFTQTRNFTALITILIMALAFMGYNLRVRSLKKSKLLLEKLIDERTSEILMRKEEIETQKEEIEAQQKEIESKNNELQQINTRLEDIVTERSSQLKSTYQDLLDVNRELDTFIYRSVHDVRGPIARLQGLSYLISLETEDKKVLELVERLNLTAYEMNELFYRLINIIRLKSSELNVTKIDLEPLVKEIVTRICEERNCEVKTTIVVSDNFVLLTDQNNVKLILSQLIDNAVKFRNAKKPELTIEASMVDNGMASIKVSDNGLGIDDDIADHIFDMFFVGQEYIQGAGLGLYAVKTAVKVLKGEIKLVSNKAGQTCFEVLIPSNV
ncbi:MAG: two-component regulator propeller domain-containing protein [Fulvivirga sp.]|uniref:two-component regulator propeller domain-containing protein n=1 Tax=Fulvivirga sp. TaxID=1931237 RepID=UPI0032F05E60